MTNYLRDNEGKFIPASQRPDGTWRKARRVKEGYVPQEEVPLYESKGKQFAARKSDLPVGMCPLVAQAAKEKRDKQRKNKANPAPGVIVLPNNQNSNSNDTSKSAPPRDAEKSTKAPNQSKQAVNEPVVESLAHEVDELSLDPERQEQLKKLRKLKKKIREIESIEAKIKSGELKKPEKDQLDKVKRKHEILAEIQELENSK